LIDDKGFFSGNFDLQSDSTPIEKQSMVPKALIRRDQIINQKNPPSVYKVYH
jgi:hypothetical protein